MLLLWVEPERDIVVNLFVGPDVEGGVVDW